MNTLYRFFDHEGRLLYVGKTTNIAGRLATHRSEKAWWTEVAAIEVEHYACERHLNRAERNAIIAERPLYNVTHNPAPPTSAGVPPVAPRPIASEPAVAVA